MSNSAPKLVYLPLSESNCVDFFNLIWRLISFCGDWDNWIWWPATSANVSTCCNPVWWWWPWFVFLYFHRISVYICFNVFANVFVFCIGNPDISRIYSIVSIFSWRQFPQFDIYFHCGGYWWWIDFLLLVWWSQNDYYGLIPSQRSRPLRGRIQICFFLALN